MFKKKKRKAGGGALSRMHAADGAATRRDLPVVVTDGADAIQARKRRATAINSFGAKPAARRVGCLASASASDGG